MWKRNEEEPGFLSSSKNAAPAAGEVSVIGRSVTMRGELQGEQDLLLEGKVEGTLRFEQHCVTIGAHGSMTGDIFAREIHIRGELQGDMKASEQVVVHETGNVRGNVTAPQVCLENGAKLKGTIDMDPQPHLDMVEGAMQHVREAGDEVSRLKTREILRKEVRAEQENADAVQ